MSFVHDGVERSMRLLLVGRVTLESEMITGSGVRRTVAAVLAMAVVCFGMAPAGAQTVRVCDGLTATIVGTPDDDMLTGTPGPDVIAALQGDDVIWGLGGDDVICGGLGSDTVVGGEGFDMIFGAQGNDVYCGPADVSPRSNSASSPPPSAVGQSPYRSPR